MKLKDYQIDVLDQLSVYLARLAEKRTEAEEFVEFQKTKGRDATVGDYCRDAWESLSDQLPQVTRQDGPSFPRRTYRGLMALVAQFRTFV